jgi:transcriptional regulator with PAS, ATPase and Fis domain
MGALRLEIEWAARSTAKVLITGPSGAGKELVAHAIHRGSARARRSFVALNCAGIPDSLLESELFGHTRGSFTGAVRDRAGVIESAVGGTLFLDEVGEMSLRMQALLLRFLENGEMQRIGADRERRASDVRVIVATNRNLREHITSGAFREDLYYRLNVIQIAVPPLCERLDDVPLLVKVFIQQYSARHGCPAPALDDPAMALLCSYQWPGNVRELRNVIERLVVRATNGRIRAADLPAEMRRTATVAPAPIATPARSTADELFDEMVTGGRSFWSVVYPPLIARDLTRDQLRQIVGRGLQTTQGSYKTLVDLFNMKADDYKSFLGFLRKHGCHMPFQQFRTRILAANHVPGVRDAPAARSRAGNAM